MSGRINRVVLCGAADRADAPADALRLRFKGKDRNISADVIGLGNQLIANVPRRMKDLLRIATYVFSADAGTRRNEPSTDDGGAAWRRNFDFTLPVHEPGFWGSSEVMDALVDLLSFLTEDDYNFNFVDGPEESLEQLTLAPEGSSWAPFGDVDEVMLFSGGADSLTGAANAVLRERRNVVLVSHHSSDKVKFVQDALFEELKARRGSAQGPWRIEVKVRRHDDELHRVRMLRSRSFLFAAMAGCVASLLGKDSVSFYENGIVSFNFPVSAHTVGAKSTRTTHPKVLRAFQRILSLVVERDFKVVNPFVWKTRSEVFGVLKETGHQDLLSMTSSCAYVVRAAEGRPHCGECSQCIDRRFSAIDAGIAEHDPANRYTIDVITGARSREKSRLFLLEYVDRFDGYRKIKSWPQFLAVRGEAARAVRPLVGLTHPTLEAVGQAVADLHRRQGEAIDRVIAHASAEHGAELRAGELPADSLLPLLAAQAVARATRPPVWEQDDLPGYFFGPSDSGWRLRFRGGRVVTLPAHRGFRYLQHLLTHRDRVVSALDLLTPRPGGDLERHRVATLKDDVSWLSRHAAGLDLRLPAAREAGEAGEAVRLEEIIAELRACLPPEKPKFKRDDLDLRKRAHDEITSALREALALIRDTDGGPERSTFAVLKHLEQVLHVGFISYCIDDGSPWVCPPASPGDPEVPAAAPGSGTEAGPAVLWVLADRVHLGDPGRAVDAANTVALLTVLGSMAIEDDQYGRARSGASATDIESRASEYDIEVPADKVTMWVHRARGQLDKLADGLGRRVLREDGGYCIDPGFRVVLDRTQSDDDGRNRR